MKYIVEHEQYGPVIIDTETQTYQYIDPDDFKFMNGIRFFNNSFEFELSPVQKAIIPIVCLSVKKIKARTMASFLDWNNKILNFYNVERIENRWQRNAMDNAIETKCYFATVEKNKLAVNDFILLSLSEIKKGLGD